jgi:hypothetical protein
VFIYIEYLGTIIAKKKIFFKRDVRIDVSMTVTHEWEDSSICISYDFYKRKSPALCGR